MACTIHKTWNNSSSYCSTEIVLLFSIVELPYLEPLSSYKQLIQAWQYTDKVTESISSLRQSWLLRRLVQRFHCVSINISRWDCLRLAKVITQCLVPVNSISSFPCSTMLLISLLFDKVLLILIFSRFSKVESSFDLIPWLTDSKRFCCCHL
jgi:hypothetical protein